MFGLSLAETAIILLVGVLVIGPKELPTVVRAIARVMAQLRNITSEFREQFDELAKEAELQALKEDLLKDATPMPTLIDLEGKEQPVYDITDEKMEAAKRRALRQRLPALQSEQKPQPDTSQIPDEPKEQP